jgi:hypothetical protein
MFEHGLLEPEILVGPIASLQNLDLVSSLHKSIRLPAACGTTSQTHTFVEGSEYRALVLCYRNFRGNCYHVLYLTTTRGLWNFP